MTEALPVTDISFEEIQEAGAGGGVCVGRPLAGVDVSVAPLEVPMAATTIRTGSARWSTGPG